MVKNLTANTGDTGLIPGWGRSPGEGNGNPVLLPEKSHGQRSLEGYSPWDSRVGNDLATKKNSNDQSVYT